MVWSVMGFGCWAGWVGWVGWCGEWIGSQRIPCIYVHCMYIHFTYMYACIRTFYIILYSFKEEIRGTPQPGALYFFYVPFSIVLIAVEKRRSISLRI